MDEYICLSTNLLTLREPECSDTPPGEGNNRVSPLSLPGPLLRLLPFPGEEEIRYMPWYDPMA